MIKFYAKYHPRLAYTWWKYILFCFQNIGQKPKIEFILILSLKETNQETDSSNFNCEINVVWANKVTHYSTQILTELFLPWKPSEVTET